MLMERAGLSAEGSRAEEGRRVLPATLLVAAALGQPMAACLARWDWRADLLTHFPAPALVVTLLAAAVLATRRQTVLASGLILLALVQTVPLIRYEGSNPVPSGSARLRILTVNVLETNGKHDAVARLIERERPDVVGLIEVTTEWLDGLERAGVRKEYPYRRELPNPGGIGMALWFRHEPRQIVTISVGPGGNPALRGTFDFAGREHQLWLVHPPNPLQAAGRYRCNRELAALARQIRDAGGSQVVIGDLNRTDGSPYFHDFLRTTGLRDSRLGFGTQPTWPSWSPYRIAIDHAFLSADLAVANRRTGPDIGSDHLPVLLDVSTASRDATNSSTQPSQRSR